MLSRGRVYRYPPPRGTPDAGMAYDMGAMQMHQGTPLRSVPVGALASLLANASPADQRMVQLLFLLYKMSFMDIIRKKFQMSPCKKTTAS